MLTIRKLKKTMPCAICTRWGAKYAVGALPAHARCAAGVVAYFVEDADRDTSACWPVPGATQLARSRRSALRYNAKAVSEYHHRTAAGIAKNKRRCAECKAAKRTKVFRWEPGIITPLERPARFQRPFQIRCCESCATKLKKQSAANNLGVAR